MNSTFMTTKITKLPNVLFMKLMRFKVNYETGMEEKINSRFEYPLELNMRSYLM